MMMMRLNEVNQADEIAYMVYELRTVGTAIKLNDNYAHNAMMQQAFTKLNEVITKLKEANNEN